MGALNALIVVCLVLAACSSTRDVTQPPRSDAGLEKEYRIGVGDALQISVWRNAELSVSVPVRPDGKICMPLIGDVAAAQLTATELSESTVRGLTRYVRSPQVTVIVSNPSSTDSQR